MPQDSSHYTPGSSLVQFVFEGAPVRVIPRDGEPWFVLVDVCKVLGIANSRNVSNRLDEGDEKGSAIVDTLGGPQQMTIVNEAGVFAAVFTSNRPDAKRFQKWVTSEVLPAIRRTGSYGIPEESKDVELKNQNVKLRTVSTAYQAWGKAAAQKVWIDVGLPTPWMQDATVHEGSRQESVINKEALIPTQKARTSKENIRQAESVVDYMHRLLKEITYTWISERDIIRNTRWLGYSERELMIKALIAAGEIEQRTEKSHLRGFNLYRRVIGYVPGDKVHLVS